jgi:hypothetical protein
MAASSTSPAMFSNTNCVRMFQQRLAKKGEAF